jgi:hypothetical protein
MSVPSLSFQELEALHDVIEAARCYWNKHPLARQRAEPVLRMVNTLYWRLGEELPKTGVPSERFQPVIHSPTGSLVEQLAEFALDLSREYANQNDPWWADTVLVSKAILDELSSDDFVGLEDALERLGMVVLMDQTLPAGQMAVERRDMGPWPELAIKST